MASRPDIRNRHRLFAPDIWCRCSWMRGMDHPEFGVWHLPQPDLLLLDPLPAPRCLLTLSISFGLHRQRTNAAGGPSGLGDSNAFERSRPRNCSARYSSPRAIPLQATSTAEAVPAKTFFRTIQVLLQAPDQLLCI